MKNKSFRNIKYSIQKTGASSSVECIINLDSVRYLAEEVCYKNSTSLEKYVSKIKSLSDDLEELGKKIYKDDKSIYFGYYFGISDLGTDETPEMFGFGVYHHLYKNSDFKYHLSINVDEMQRNIKITSILGDEE